MDSSETPKSQDPEAIPNEAVTCEPEISYLGIKFEDFVSDLEDDEDQIETTVHPHPLTAFLPPFIFTSHLSPAQKALQPFPYNMSASNGIITWIITATLATIFFWLQNSALDHYQLYRSSECRSIVILYVVLLVMEFFLGVCSSLYPLVYGCVLRWNVGSWPSRGKVWGSEWEQENGDDDDGETGFSGTGTRLAEYTLIGVLILGAWKLARGDNATRDEKKSESRQQEKLRLLEEGKDSHSEKKSAGEAEFMV